MKMMFISNRNARKENVLAAAGTIDAQQRNMKIEPGIFYPSRLWFYLFFVLMRNVRRSEKHCRFLSQIVIARWTMIGGDERSERGRKKNKFKDFEPRSGNGFMILIAIATYSTDFSMNCLV